jgi:predicted LPLAT superfamily acyltransferase
VSADRWADIAEIGTARALRFAGLMQRVIGRRGARLLISPAVLYYFLSDGRARRASRAYLERIDSTPAGRRALGRPPGPVAVFRHMFEFALSLYDRLGVWSGALRELELDHDGSGRIFDVAREGRGALLLSAHLGSIDMLWFLSKKYALVVNVVAYFDHAERINAFFRSLSPDATVRAIEIDPDAVRCALAIRACIERGELVVIVADRTPPERSVRVAETHFLGRNADFPLPPFELAGVLGCPVFFALCLRRGEAHYQTILRALAPAEHVGRHERGKRAREVLAKYASLVEQYCCQEPYQWFNFYDFWRRGEDR